MPLAQGYFPFVVQTADLTAQQANVGSTVLYTVPAAGAGMYRINAYAVITQAATTSSQLPQAVVQATDPDTSVVESIGFGGTPTTNTVGTTNLAGNGATTILNAKSGTNISISTQLYASVGATPMQYAIHVKLEYLGP